LRLAAAGRVRGIVMAASRWLSPFEVRAGLPRLQHQPPEGFRLDMETGLDLSGPFAPTMESVD